MILAIKQITITFLLVAFTSQVFSNNLFKDPPTKKSKPNIIVIMADDLGYADVGFNGCTDIPTPNIDRIAKNGVVCTNGYTTYSVCGPSRAGFITGRYQQRFGFERNPQYRPHDPNMGLPKSEATLAETLKKVNYTSGIIGK
ncbi:MAG: sulfatase-like hydrolase/transferase, partial [Flavicella sp.]|nr:sulfatase-like hydrolase/transferase [Flavicella sp.]